MDFNDLINKILTVILGATISFYGAWIFSGFVAWFGLLTILLAVSDIVKIDIE